jgi:hypothetical protein
MLNNVRMVAPRGSVRNNPFFRKNLIGGRNGEMGGREPTGEYWRGRGEEDIGGRDGRTSRLNV